MADTTSRILALLNLLQTHRQWRGGELADRLGVTERTLRRDIERLRELGYQVDATRGVAGGYRLEAGSQLPPLLLTDEEAVTLVIALRVAATGGLADAENTTLTALAKLEQVLPSALRRRVNALSAVQPQRPGEGAPASRRPGPDPISHDLIGELALACRDRERIRFHYVAADGTESDRLVEPQNLVPTPRTWFLVCWDVQREAWRTFRVDRMSKLFATRVSFPERMLPADDAAQFVREAHSSLRRKVVAGVHFAIGVDELKERFDGYADEAVAGPGGAATSSVWPIRGDTPAQLLSWLAWIPDDLDYRVEAEPEVLSGLRAVARRLQKASAANSPLSVGRG